MKKLFALPIAFFVTMAVAVVTPVWSAETGSMAGLPSFADIVERVSPAVVNISITKKAAIRPTAGPGQLPPALRGSPLEEFFGRQFQGPDTRGRDMPAQGLGSGFILDSDGYVVTNYHVIEGAEKIVVTLDNGDQLHATLVGEDPKTDLALLKVESAKPLSRVTLGDAAKVRVGDWVLAIGNPFGLGGTATAGIVSAKGRDIQAGPYDDYLQIDASINSGNSGGPVFDTQGRVVGVNTAIYSPNGGSVGIGFAIPVSQVAAIVTELKQQGHVTRGWLGIQIQPLDEPLAKSLKLDDKTGALIADVTAGSPAALGGLSTGDVVVAFDGEPIDSPKALSRQVAAHDPGEKVWITVWRDGRKQSLHVTLGRSEESPAVAVGPASGEGRAYEDLGLSMTPLDESVRRQLGVSDDTEGLVVTAVEPGSVASENGLRRGDVVRSVNGETVSSLGAMDKALRAARSRDGTALLLVKRGDGQRFVAVDLV